MNNLKKSGVWKIRLTIEINFMSSKDTDEESVMHSKSDNIEIMISDKVDEVTEELFRSRLSRYEFSMKDTGFIFDCIYLFFYERRKINLKCGGS